MKTRLLFVFMASAMILFFSAQAKAWDPLKQPLDNARQRVEVFLVNHESLVQSAAQLAKALDSKKDIVVAGLAYRIQADVQLELDSKGFAIRDIVQVARLIEFCESTGSCSNQNELNSAKEEVRKLSNTVLEAPAPRNFEENLLKAKTVLKNLVKSDDYPKLLPKSLSAFMIRIQSRELMTESYTTQITHFATGVF